jgi:hypothetical protein
MVSSCVLLLRNAAILHVLASVLHNKTSGAGATSSQEDRFALVKAFCLKRKQVS